MNYYTMPGIKRGIDNASKGVHRSDLILEAVSTYFNISKWLLVNQNGRQAEKVYRRFVAIYLLRNDTNLTLKSVGKIFRRDHTSVIHAIADIEHRLSIDPYTISVIRAIRSQYM